VSGLVPASTSPLPWVFITGASSGIGRALACAYRQRGWRVALVARRLNVLQAWVQSQGWTPEQALCCAADVTQIDPMIAAAHHAMAHFGSLPDVVIANAGIGMGVNTAEREDLAVLQEILATNITGLAHTFHPFLQPMQQRRQGTLVVMASVAALRGLPGHGAYCASKAAAVAYAESLRGEYRAHGLRVVTLLPGYVATALTADNPYRMPFLLSAEAFAEQALRVIDRGVAYRIIPWPMRLVGLLLRWLPAAGWDALMARRPRKHRRTQVP